MSDPRLHFRQPLATSPFHARIAAANRIQSWAPWAGYMTALAFEDVTTEYTAIRNQASLYDLSPMTKYRIEGRDAESYLNRLTLRDVARQRPGTVQYTAWCDDDGKVMDDGTLFRFTGNRFRLCCQERHLPWLMDGARGFDVSVADETEDVAALSLQGPCAFSVLAKAGFADLANLRPFEIADVPFAGGLMQVSRTGFTGDLGYEVWSVPDLALPLWDHLMEAGKLYGLRPVGSAALNMARIEAGFIIANMDFIAAEQALRDDRRRSPFEIGLDWMVKFDKGHFNGRRALLAERDGNGACWALVGLDIEGNVPAEQSLVYHAKSREVGQINAGIWSPSAKKNIALASLRRPWHMRDEDLWVEIYALRELQYHKLMVRARITPRPFFSPARRRQTPPSLF